MTSKYEYGIGFARCIAMISIVVCHIFQAIGNDLCFYFNVGVPIFLFLSGYLYGKKKITDIGRFYTGRAVRILVPYYIMLVIILIVNATQGIGVSLKGLLSSVLCQQWYGYSITNGGHLWYVTCILFCYLVTPCLQWLNEQTKNLSNIVFWGIFVIGICLLQLIQTVDGMTQNVYSLAAYGIGYFCSARMEGALRKVKKGMWLSLLGIGSCVFVAKYFLERNGFTIPGILYEYYKCWFGTVFCLNTIYIYIYRNEEKSVPWLLKFSDRYSYMVYLTHHIFILGALSTMQMTSNFVVNIILAITLTIISAIVLHWVSEKVSVLIFKRDKKENA